MAETKLAEAKDDFDAKGERGDKYDDPARDLGKVRSDLESLFSEPAVAMARMRANCWGTSGRARMEAPWGRWGP